MKRIARGVPERLPIDGFLDRCEPYSSGAGLMVKQPFRSRFAEGMIRASRTSIRRG